MPSDSHQHKLTAAHLLAFAVVAALSAAPLIVSPLLPARTILWFEIQNAAHFVVFFLVGWIFMGIFRVHAGTQRPVAQRRYWQTMFWCVLLGGATEALQFFLPRDADLIDFFRNVAGAFVALAIYRLIDLARHRQQASWRDRLLLVLSTLVLLAAFGSLIGWAASYFDRDRSFPLLADFEADLWPTFIAPKGARLRWVPPPSGFSELASGRSLEVGFRGEGWPGFELREPFPDWRGYKHLQIAVMNPTSSEHTLHLRIDDALYTDGYGDRYNGSFKISPGTTLLQVSLQDVRAGPRNRTLDLSAIRSLILFAQAGDTPFVLFFDNIRLAP